MHAGCNVQSYGSGEHNHALVAFLPCILGRHGACKHLGSSERAAPGRRDPVGVASRNRGHLGSSERAAPGRRDPVGVASRNRGHQSAETARVHTKHTRD